MLYSAETKAPLYCELCDAQSGRRDAEQIEQELRAEVASLRALIEQMQQAASAGEWVRKKDAYGALVESAAELIRLRTEGDSLTAVQSERLDSLICGLAVRMRARADTLPAAPTQAVQEPALTGCNCRWRGDEYVEKCELHEAWRTAIHEWAERAKAAEKAAQEPVDEAQAPNSEPRLTEIEKFDAYMRRNYPDAKGDGVFARAIDALEAMDAKLGMAPDSGGALMVFAQEVILGAYKPEELPDKARAAVARHARERYAAKHGPWAREPAVTLMDEEIAEIASEYVWYDADVERHDIRGFARAILARAGGEHE
jgi:hypothetical protein